MTDFYFDVTKTDGTAAGTDWTNGKPLRELQSLYTTVDPAAPGDRYFIGCDPQKEFSYFLSGETIILNRNGTSESPIEFYFGGFGNRISTAVDQASFKLIGDRINPWYRDLALGSNYASVSGNHQKFSGLKVSNLDVVFALSGAVNGFSLADISAENVSYIFFGDDPYSLSNANFENIFGNQINNGLIRIPASSSNIKISNFSCVNSSSENGEFRGINIRENSSNVEISDGFISGGVDMYTGINPSTTGDYNQGDGISAESGTDLKIRRVIVNDCTDRGIDVKAVADIFKADISGCKIGIATWADGSIVRDCKVINPRGNSNNLGYAYQAIGKTDYFNCEANVLSNEARGVFDFTSGGSIVGGVFNFDPSSQYFLRSPSANVTVRIVDAYINGVLTTINVNLSAGQTWIP